MKIKEYKCKCGNNDFFFADIGHQKGIYCTYCGKCLKWADKSERNLAMANALSEALERRLYVFCKFKYNRFIAQ